MRLAAAETKAIADIIRPILDEVAAAYDYSKYPADAYSGLRTRFSALAASDADIEAALLWKWGHTGKSNYPGHHKALIAEARSLWPEFIASTAARDPKATFDWWTGRWGRKRFITVAFLTHLVHFVHHEAAIPIIDQHNYRGANHLLAQIRPVHEFKKKPSNWDDLMILAEFVRVVGEELGIDSGKLDRFLMMYGRDHAPRSRRGSQVKSSRRVTQGLHRPLRDALEAATELHDRSARVDLRDLTREQLLDLMGIAKVLRDSGEEVLRAIVESTEDHHRGSR